MKESNLYMGDAKVFASTHDVAFDTVSVQGDLYYRIHNIDQMPPFFMTIVSDVDFWMFLSSTGGITAGRKNPDSALFPYYTDDKIHDSAETTGPHTIFIVGKGDKRYLWEPFSTSGANVYRITRNLYKNTIGNKIIFEEHNAFLDVTFRYRWETSDRYGFVKTSELINSSGENIDVTVLDGIRNILPYGVDAAAQMSRSTLVDGYKRCELIESCGLGIYNLSSIITDRAEPSESLKATIVWSAGIDKPVYLLSEGQVAAFKRGERLTTELDVKGRRGAYYLSGEFSLAEQSSKEWVIVAEINQNASRIESLIETLGAPGELLEDLKKDVESGSENLKRLVFEADGIQLTANQRQTNRHFSNTLYNIMRGGIYAEGYQIDIKDLKDFINKWNHGVYAQNRAFIEALPVKMNYFDLIETVENHMDRDLERLVREYLPLTYSRRHGDPSRPWNRFNIEIAKSSGELNLNFEGNWRDIFQNWEALSLSYPGYIESIITKFVNASTADGYNPYRITKEGVDWEVLEKDDVWSNIGYWGDHQVIYLLKLMELSQKVHPSKLASLLTKSIFVYANVPYRIKGFDEIVKDPRNTILFDEEVAAYISEKVKAIGSDGKLVFQGDQLYHVNLMEKLLVQILVKISNYIPKGGIWMNTQRPEWNDANNALVGNGVSMVTLYYLHRMLGFVEALLETLDKEVMISTEVIKMLEGIYEVFKASEKALSAEMTDASRFDMVTKLGRIGEAYRETLYSTGFSGIKKGVSVQMIRDFIAVSMKHLKDTITANKREDGLYHAYNLIKFTPGACSLSYLYEMLEGQVAVLSSKAIDGDEALSVLKALRDSAIYREDQNSYMLYPVRELPRFLEKNVIPEALVNASPVLVSELEKGLKRFIEKSVNGHYHFNGQYRNGTEIVADILKTGEYSERDALQVGELFTDLFDHHAYTGRSGTFYKYEGLGCIYWHMVSKLVLAAGENFTAMASVKPFAKETKELSHIFHELKDGIGVEKSPVDYGAFPTDAYSHTPGFAGVQQPGMTGQVKEDFISRFTELGVDFSGGEVSFNPKLLQKSEFLDAETVWELPHKTLTLTKKQLGFTLCTVPIIYEHTNYEAVTVYYENGDRYTFENTTKLSREISRSLFRREGKIDKILVRINY